MWKKLTMIPLSVVVFSALVSAQQAPATPATAAAPQPQTARPPAQLANIRIELTVSDQRGDAQAAPKTITMLVEDRQNGRIRTGRNNTNLNVDGHAEILREGRIRLILSLEYAPQDGPDRGAPIPISESIVVLLEDGKPLVVSQSADPTSDRKVRLEVKATIVK
jgi:hypothetical protein